MNTVRSLLHYYPPPFLFYSTMSFTSKASKHQAEQTVNKLFADILHTQPSSSSSSKTKDDDAKLSSTQILTNQLHPTTGSTNTSKSKSLKRRKLQKIKKKETKDKKFEKFIKYNQILSKPESQQTESDKAYIRKLIRKNTNQVRNLSHIDDFEVELELEAVKLQLLADLQLKLKGKLRLRKKLIVPKSKNDSADDDDVTKLEFIDFDDKVKRGLISMPGLTPGLAPVDENESESELE